MARKRVPRAVKPRSNDDVAAESRIRTQIHPHSQVIPSLRWKTQEESYLGRFPAEIRRMIFEELLIADGPLSKPKIEYPGCDTPEKEEARKKTAAIRWKARTETWENSPSYHSDKNSTARVNMDTEKLKNSRPYSYNLHPAILRTCQSFFVEGVGLLYNKNVVEVRLKVEHWPTQPPWHYSYIPRLYVFDDQILENGRPRMDRDISIMRFKNFMFTVSHDSITGRYLNYIPNERSCKALRTLLDVKVGTIFKNKSIDVNIVGVERWSPFLQLQVYASFMFIKCDNFEFLDSSDPFPSHVANEVMSSKPLINLVDCSTVLHPLLRKMIKYTTRYSTEMTLRRLRTDLKNTIEMHNIISFTYFRQKVLGKWHQELLWAKRRHRLVCYKKVGTTQLDVKVSYHYGPYLEEENAVMDRLNRLIDLSRLFFDEIEGEKEQMWQEES